MTVPDVALTGLRPGGAPHWHDGRVWFASWWHGFDRIDLEARMASC